MQPGIPGRKPGTQKQAYFQVETDFFGYNDGGPLLSPKFLDTLLRSEKNFKSLGDGTDSFFNIVRLDVQIKMGSL